MVKRIRANFFSNGFTIASVAFGNEFVLYPIGINAVMARMSIRRRTDSNMNFFRSRFAKHRDDFFYNGRTNDGVINNDNPFSGNKLGNNIEFYPKALFTPFLNGLDERAPDIVRPKECHNKREPCFRGKTGGGKVSGVRNRYDDIRRNGRFFPKPLAHFFPGRLSPSYVKFAVGTQKVNIFKNAEFLFKRRVVSMIAYVVTLKIGGRRL